mmetsp:Transcript_90449/g.281296  ORF Transcript_90449/g.281296 Transcript_90449/m.281296 type:complete len:207 (+) Transcript_90449:165-785(+)
MLIVHGRFDLWPVLDRDLHDAALGSLVDLPAVLAAVEERGRAIERRRHGVSREHGAHCGPQHVHHAPRVHCQLDDTPRAWQSRKQPARLRAAGTEGMVPRDLDHGLGAVAAEHSHIEAPWVVLQLVGALGEGREDAVGASVLQKRRRDDEFLVIDAPVPVEGIETAMQNENAFDRVVAFVIDLEFRLIQGNFADGVVGTGTTAERL